MAPQYRIAVLPGDGIGPEVMEQALKVLAAIQQRFGFTLSCEQYDVEGLPLIIMHPTSREHSYRMPKRRRHFIWLRRRSEMGTPSS